MNRILQSHIAAAALAFLAGGANQQALMQATPDFSLRQRKKVVHRAHFEMRQHSAPQAIIARMTNWQRNQWGKAGNPMDVAKLEHFAALPHHKKAQV